MQALMPQTNILEVVCAARLGENTPDRRKRNERGQDCGNLADCCRRPWVGIWRFQLQQGTHDVKLGPIEFSVKEKQKVNVPIWGGVGAIVIGGALLVFGSKRS
jgi:hypothetical protein